MPRLSTMDPVGSSKPQQQSNEDDHQQPQVKPRPLPLSKTTSAKYTSFMKGASISSVVTDDSISSYSSQETASTAAGSVVMSKSNNGNNGNNNSHHHHARMSEKEEQPSVSEEKVAPVASIASNTTTNTTAATAMDTNLNRGNETGFAPRSVGHWHRDHFNQHEQNREEGDTTALNVPQGSGSGPSSSAENQFYKHDFMQPASRRTFNRTICYELDQFFHQFQKGRNSNVRNAVNKSDDDEKSSRARSATTDTSTNLAPNPGTTSSSVATGNVSNGQGHGDNGRNWSSSYNDRNAINQTSSNNDTNQQQQQQQYPYYEQQQHTEYYKNMNNHYHLHEGNHEYAYDNRAKAYDFLPSSHFGPSLDHQANPSYHIENRSSSLSYPPPPIVSPLPIPSPMLPPPPSSSFPISQDTNAALRELIMFEAEVEKQYQKCQRMQQEVEKEKHKYLRELEIAKVRRIEIARKIADGLRRDDINNDGNNETLSSESNDHGGSIDSKCARGKNIAQNEDSRNLVMEMKQDEINDEKMKHSDNNMFTGFMMTKQQQHHHHQQQQQALLQNEKFKYHDGNVFENKMSFPQHQQQHQEHKNQFQKQMEKKQSTKHYRKASSALDALALVCAADNPEIAERNTAKATSVPSSNVNMNNEDCDQDISPRSIVLEGDGMTMQQAEKNILHKPQSAPKEPDIQKNELDDSEKLLNPKSTKSTNRTKQTFARLKRNHLIHESGRKLKEERNRLQGESGRQLKDPPTEGSGKGALLTKAESKTPLDLIYDNIPSAPQPNASSSRILLSEKVAPLNPKDDDLAAHHFRNVGSWSPNVTINDVLCGRGGLTNNHGGNVFFRSLVRSRQEAYLFASKRDKALVAHGIVDVIRSLDPPGRFLKKNKNQIWVEIGNKKAREKTSQALREKAPELMEMLQKDFGDAGFENHSQFLPSQSSNDGSETDNCGPPVEKKRRKSLNNTVVDSGRAFKNGKQNSKPKKQNGDNDAHEGTTRFVTPTTIESFHDCASTMSMKRKHQFVKSETA